MGATTGISSLLRFLKVTIIDSEKHSCFHTYRSRPLLMSENGEGVGLEKSDDS